MDKLTGLGRQKPMSMIVYQPRYVGNVKDKRTQKYNGFVKKKFPFFPVEIGKTVFTTEKRPAGFLDLLKQKEYAVEAVKINMFDGNCIVILERKVIKKAAEKPKGEKKVFKGAQVFEEATESGLNEPQT